MFFALTNLTKKAVSPCDPWEFRGERPSDEICSDKQKRQQFYKDPSTNWQFYTAVESANPNQRSSREDNPPRFLHGVVADYDLPQSDDFILAAVAAMPIKPAWRERSLGGNARLVWIFPCPLAVDSYDFCVALLQASKKWLQTDRLAGLDVPALSDPNRLYCNGGAWIETGYGPISETALQAFFFTTAKEFRFVSPEGMEIPLDVVEKKLLEKYPKFAWPGEFALESSGPSFWIPESQSSNSAVLKAEGFLTFSARADKLFFRWADLLGADFVKEFSTASIAKATTDIWHDGRKFWRRKKGAYVAMEMAELVNYMKTTCGISAKGKRLEQSLSHIYEENYVENAAPYLFRPPGLLVYQGKRRLNTANNEIIKPAAEGQKWGPQGNFPFLSSLLDNLFTTEIQRDHFLSWYQYFFVSGMNSQPVPGPVIFLMGGICTGKTFTSREIVGRSVGGYVDAAGYIIRGSEFNSHLFESALMVMDDDAVSDSPAAAANVQAMLKKSVANTSFLSNKKFQSAGMVEWQGRIIATTNLDYVSSRILGPLDNSSLDKISVFRCAAISKIKFPSRPEMERLVSTELPFLLRWLVDHTPPDYVKRDSRFGFSSYHEDSLMERASQTSKSGPFKEILIETLEEYFRDTPEAVEWRGTVSKLIQQMHMNPLHEHVIRTLRLESVSRYLESIEKDGALRCRTITGALNTRIWIFPRLVASTVAVEAPALAPQRPSIFDK